MNASIAKRFTVWLALVVLSVAGFYNSAVSARGVAYVVVAIGFVKFFLIFWNFMEMKRAHALWKALMGAYVIALGGALGYLI